MIIRIISFTRKGFETAKLIGNKISVSKEIKCNIYAAEKYAVYEDANVSFLRESVGEWTKRYFFETDALIYIGACQIAVRSIAPFIKSKDIDPAIIAVDELGRYAICLLSGHLGGGNELTSLIADSIGAAPVITTATDINSSFAVDVFARKNKLIISDIKGIKKISSSILDGESVSLYYDSRFISFKGRIPDKIQIIDKTNMCLESVTEGIVVSHLSAEKGTINLVPSQIYIGIGCKKNTQVTKMYEYVCTFLARLNINPLAVKAVCTIDIKAEEEAIVQLGKRLDKEVLVFDRATLNEQDGDFTASEFVKSVTGVDNVCERTVMAAGAHEILLRKQSFDGMTIAIGFGKEEISFE